MSDDTTSANSTSLVDILRDFADSLRNPATDRKRVKLDLLELEQDLINLGGPEEIRLLRQLTTERGMGTDCNRIIKQMERVQKGVGALRLAEPGEEAGYAAPAKIPKGWVDPKGWRCTKAGVLRGRETGLGGYEWSQITLTPIWIEKRWKDVDTGDHHFRLEWPDGGETVSRGTAMQARELAALAAKGAPVTSRSSADVVDWLEKAEEANLDTIPTEKAIGRVGWVGTGKNRQLQRGDGPMMLRASDGHEQIARSMQPVGTWERWLESAAEVHKQPIPALMLAASVCSVVLDIVGGRPFVVDLNGHSSRGKTTALRWAVSAFANPTDDGGYLQSWSTTVAAVEMKAAFLRSFPLAMDDTKKMPIRERDRLLTVIMQWGSGQGKARAKPDGSRPTPVWKSVMLSTGEAPLARLAGENVGMRLRVLSIQGEPFPPNSPGVGEVECVDSWGHVAPRVERYILSAEAQVKKFWAMKRDAMAERLNEGGPGRRLAEFTASVETAIMVLMAIGVPFPKLAETTNLLYEACKVAVASSNTTEESWHRIGAWLAGNEGRISEQSGAKDENPPSQGWIGRAIGSGVVAVSPPVLDAELRRLGYDPEEILPLWVAKKWLSPSADGSLTKVCKWMGKSARLYHLQDVDGWEGKVV